MARLPPTEAKPTRACLAYVRREDEEARGSSGARAEEEGSGGGGVADLEAERRMVVSPAAAAI